MKYTIIYYGFSKMDTLVETWDMPLEKVIDRCKLIFQDGDYKRAEVLEHNCKYVIENKPVEYYDH